jgi:oligoendopeptidase F
VAEKPRRDRVSADLTWNLADIYGTGEEWEADRRRVEDGARSVAAYRGRFGQDATTFRGFLQARDALLQRLNRVVEYARLYASADGTAAEHQAMVARAGELSAKVEAALAFFPAEEPTGMTRPVDRGASLGSVLARVNGALSIGPCHGYLPAAAGDK